MSKIFKVAELLAQVCGGWWSLMSGAISIPIGVLALFIGGSPGLWLAILAFVALWAFAIRTAWKNYQLMKRTLEIEAVPSDIKTPQKHLCQIRVRNNSSTTAADNVQVELIGFADDLGNKGVIFHPPLPLLLKPEIDGANTINPGASLAYNLFQVLMHKAGTRQENETEMIWRQDFLAYFKPGDMTKNLASFTWKKNYRLKLAATSRAMRVEQEFNLKFSDEGDFCRFALTKIQP